MGAQTIIRYLESIHLLRVAEMSAKEIIAMKIRARKDSFGRISILISHPLVKSDTKHQKESQSEKSNKSIYPVKTRFKNRQENNGKQQNGCPFIPQTHKVGSIPNLISLECAIHLMSDEVIDQ